MPTSAERPRRLGFYRRLTRGQKQEYDRSDRITAIPLPARPALGEATNAVIEALRRGETRAVRVAAQHLLDGISACVVRRGRPPARAPRVKILRTRPRLSSGEYHGLYTRDASGRAEIRVWMLTAANREVVKPRTFLRTLLHELVHHFDMELLDLPSSFHTIGFHARESSLLRGLERCGAEVPGGRRGPASKDGAVRRGGPRTTSQREPKPKESSAPRRPRSAKPRRPVRGAQLDLFPGSRPE